MTLQCAHLYIMVAVLLLLLSSSFYRTAGLPLPSIERVSVIGISLEIIILFFTVLGVRQKFRVHAHTIPETIYMCLVSTIAYRRVGQNHGYRVADVWYRHGKQRGLYRSTPDTTCPINVGGICRRAFRGNIISSARSFPAGRSLAIDPRRQPHNGMFYRSPILHRDRQPPPATHVFVVYIIIQCIFIVVYIVISLICIP